MNAFNFCGALLLVGGVIFNSSLAYAQSDQYKNKEEEKQDKTEANLENLEKRYWVAKDSQFQVVQNRQYSKDKRYAFSGLLGPMINDQYSDATAIYLSGGYYFSERWGAEINYLGMNPKGNSMTTEFIDRFGVVPNHNKFNQYFGVTGSWVPVYAKASLQNSLIMYFDFSIGLGLGILRYDQQFTDKPNETKSTPAVSVDVSQQVFLSQHIALRVSFIARWFKEGIRDSRSPFEVRDESLSQTNLLMVGLTYFH